MKLTRQQRDKLWGEYGPYSQVQQIIENRVIDDHLSRRFVIVSVNVNPFTFDLVKKHREEFLDDQEILGILDHAEYQGPAYGWGVYTYNDELRGQEQLHIAEQRAEVTMNAVVKMHRFVMEKMGISTHAAWNRPRAEQRNLRSVFSEYLIEQQKRLAPKTFKHYEDAVGLFETCCDGYGYNCLDEIQSDSYKQAEEADIEFCDFFGVDVLSHSLFGEFLGYFLPRKVLSGNDTLSKYAQAILHLYRWCCEKGFITDDDPKGTTRALREEFSEALQEHERLGESASGDQSSSQESS